MGLDIISSNKEERFSFRAGSYSGYNYWRNQLAVFAGFESAESVWHGDLKGSFTEMINFSDCEGTLDAETCLKLYKDFCDNEGRAKEHPDDYFIEKYMEWKRAMEIASNNGQVDFC